MYLESLTINNYRKFKNEHNTVSFVHSDNLVEKGDDENSNLARSSTLVIGKNNTGKTTITHAIDLLVNKSATSIKSSDFNMSYLQDFLKEFISSLENSTDDEKSRSLCMPELNFELKIKIINKDKILITNLSSFISLDADINEDSILIKAFYKLREEAQFINNLKSRLKEIPTEEEAKQLLALCDLIDHEETKFKLVIENSHAIEVNDFSFKDLFSVECIKANRHLDDLTLTRIYQKIIQASFNDETDLDNLDAEIKNINNTIEQNETITKTKGMLQDVLSEMESTTHVGMELQGNVTKEQIISNLIRYIFKEGEHFIPENQFGLGYINLLNIIGHLIRYVDSYDERSHLYKINLLFIEEPEVFMHPQMQEFFISRINKGVSKVLKQKTGENNELRCQVVITTHSSHILNSKIHSSNSFNNINYVTDVENQANVIGLNDDKFLIASGDRSKKTQKNLNYLKKHIKYKVSELFFADAVILVEGMTEETILPYFIESNNPLKEYHLSIFRIDGAHSKVYLPLLKILKIPCLIITDYDLKRDKAENESNLTAINDRETTNTTLKDFFSDENNSIPYANYYERENICCVFQKDPIKGQYATSLEEALILTNYDNFILNDALKETMPQIYKTVFNGNYTNLINKSYCLQSKLGVDSRKSKFSSNLLYELIISEGEHHFNIPKYIQDGFSWLSRQLTSK